MNRDLYPMWVAEKLATAKHDLHVAEANYSSLHNKESQYAVCFNQLAEALRKVVEIWKEELAK